jgi:uncharacterized membrane protein YuzA (DUF378 family)
MIQKIKTFVITALSLAALAITPAVLVTTSASAQTADVKGGLCSGTDFKLDGSGNCDTGDGDPSSSFSSLITKIVNIFSAIVGIAAVIMIIWGGFKYITSGGDSGKVTSAKNTIIYAIIGLIIVALAQFIVKFVLQKANTAV